MVDHGVQLTDLCTLHHCTTQFSSNQIDYLKEQVAQLWQRDCEHTVS